jgi:DNA-binding NarL/FixJ family response regulator
MMELVGIELLASRAQKAVRQAIKKGRLIRPTICEQCHQQRYIRAHHDDYSKPLEVRWLCTRCHSLLVCDNHKPKKTGICNDGRGNRPKTERNNQILQFAGKGYRQKSIARIFHMKESAVSMIILRARRKAEAPVSEGAPTSK